MPHRWKELEGVAQEATQQQQQVGAVQQVEGRDAGAEERAGHRQKAGVPARVSTQKVRLSSGYHQTNSQPRLGQNMVCER